MHVIPLIGRQQILASVLAGVVAAAAVATAQTTQPKGPTDRFTWTAVNVGAVSGETVTIDLIRWSSDDERDKVVAVLKDKGDKELLGVLQQLPNLGYIWRSGSGVGAFVRYAYRWKASDGEHVVVATDSDLSSWQRIYSAKPAGAAPAAATGYPFTVIELVLPARGPSQGKMSLGATITGDSENKTIRLDNFAAAPVTIKAVKHVRGGQSS